MKQRRISLIANRKEKYPKKAYKMKVNRRPSNNNKSVSSSYMQNPNDDMYEVSPMANIPVPKDLLSIRTPENKKLVKSQTFKTTTRYQD